MTLINESMVDPNSFQKRREFWLGETSGKDKVDQTKPLMKGTKVERRKQIRSALYTLSNSISDSAFHNCNRLFWLNNGKIEASKLWEIGKSIGVTFTGEKQVILDKLEELEARYVENKK